MLTVKELDKKIDRLVKAYNSKAVKEDAQACLQEAAEFCNFHRDGTHLDKLFNLLPNTANKRGMRIWLEKYTYWKLRENKDGKKIFMSRNDEGKVEFVLNLEGLKPEYAFYNLSEVAVDAEKPVKPMDFLVMLNALLDKARKAEEEGRMKDPVARAVLHVLDADLPKLVAKVAKDQENAQPEEEKVAA